MKSRTSFFNLMAFKKDIFRFAPVWGLYTIGMLLILFLAAEERSTAVLGRNVVSYMSGMAWINLIYAGVCALLLFGDLYSSRMCNALHAFPVRREGWLLIHILSGVLFALVPNLLVTGVGCLLLRGYAYVGLYWFAVVMLQYLFFFGTAVLSAVCAGNRLAMAAIYSIIQFVVILVYAMTQLLYQPLLYSVELAEENILRYMPLLQMQDDKYLNFVYNYETITADFQGINAEMWTHLAFCVLAGFVSMGLALWVYRKRNLENAGDFISLKPLAPVFLLIYTLCAGLLLLFVAEIFEGVYSYLFLAIGLLVGFFTGQMLLKRTLKVFSKRAFLGLGVIVLALAGSMWLTWLDPVGITTYIPPKEDVKWAAIYTQNDSFRYNKNYDRAHYEIKDPAELEALQTFHKALTENRFVEDGSVDSCDIEILYERSDGSRVIRYYSIPVNTDLGEKAKQWLSDPRYLLGSENLEDLTERLVELQVDRTYYLETVKGDDTVYWLSLIDPSEIAGFVLAFQADCEAMRTAQPWEYHGEEETAYYLGAYMKRPDPDKTESWQERVDLRICQCCTNTVEYLDGIFEQYENAQ